MSISEGTVGSHGPEGRDGAAVDSSYDAIICLDLDGLITSWNPGAQHLYGYQTADILGRHSDLLDPPESRPGQATRLARVATGERIEMFGARKVHRSGEQLDVSLTLTPMLDDNGQIQGVTSASRDVGELAVAQDRSQRLMQTSVAAMLSIDQAGIVTLASDMVDTMFGYSRSELIGQPVQMLIPTLELALQSAQLNGFIAQPTVRPLGGPPLPALRKDGTTFQADIGVSSSDIDGTLIVTLGVGDPGQRVAADGARRESEARARQLAASVDVAFVLRTLNPPSYLYTSPGYQKIFGSNPFTAHRVPSVDIQHIHPQDQARFLVDYWNPTQVGLAAQAEYRIIRPDTEVRWVRSMAWPIADPGHPVSRIADTIEDITERRLAEAAIRNAYAQAEKARAAKDEFLSRTSHELRTPLNAVLGFAQLLQLDRLTNDQEDSVQHILEGGRHLLALIDDVLDIALIESDRLDLSMEAVSIASLIKDTIELMTPLAGAAQISLDYRTGQESGRYVHADNRRLRQVLLNLLSNAIKYNRQGGRVTVSCQVSDDERLDIAVEDTGRGIRGRDLPRLFTPFDRLGAQATGIEGTGVGLALSHRLMEKMGGTLHATSQFGVGTTFTASLTLHQPALESDLKFPTAGAAIPDPAVGAAKAMTVLYIEDNTSNIELMHRLVAMRPVWQLVIAQLGAHGLQRAVTGKPDLILLDLHLPDMDGIDVLHHLQADPHTNQIPVIVVSADANPHQITRLLAAGAQHYLTKPLDLAAVLTLLDKVADSSMTDQCADHPSTASAVTKMDRS